jgi:DNA processing protein
VVGTGLDRVYPRQHRDLAHRMAQHGLILSEYPLGTPPLSANFPKRNRLIAGLSQGTLVVEAALKSGSLITARLAAEQGKEVYAIPGSIHLAQSRGCHALIRQGAQLVESAAEVLQDLQPSQGAPAPPEVPTDRLKTIATNDRPMRTKGIFEPKNEILEALGHDPANLDSLMARTGLDLPHLQAQLLTLELDGRVARLPGGLFQQMARG